MQYIIFPRRYKILIGFNIGIGINLARSSIIESGSIELRPSDNNRGPSGRWALD